MPLTPIASNAPVRRFEAGDSNAAIVMNVPAQGLANQALAITEDLESIVLIQQAIATKLGQFSDAIALKDNATNLKNVLINERGQSQAGDTQATNVESGIGAITSAIATENNRVIPVNTKLDGITPTTYQAYSAVLAGIGSAAASANNFMYSDPAGAIAYATPALSSGTRMRDICLKGTIAPGATPITFPNETWTNLALLQSINMASDTMSWNAANQELTLSAGEYSIDGYVVGSRTQLIQMSLVQGTNVRYLGSTGKGTSESGVIGSAELSIYSHLQASFNISSARVYVPQIFMSGGTIPPSTIGETYPYAVLRVRHYLY